MHVMYQHWHLAAQLKANVQMLQWFIIMPVSQLGGQLVQELVDSLIRLISNTAAPHNIVVHWKRDVWMQNGVKTKI
jgi:hypothetical protein